MNADTAQALLQLNRQFYQTFALQFSADRLRLQPGVQHLLAQLPLEGRLLDLGCGNGELASALARRGQRGGYAGVDFSPGLLEIARQNVGQLLECAGNREAPSSFKCLFFQADLAAPGWEARVHTGSEPFTPFDGALAFAVLHHLPGVTLRRQVLRTVHALLASGGRLYLSVWQFLDSPRLRARLQPWERAGLSDEALDPGDALLDWRHGGYGLRYAHHFSKDELGDLAAQTGFSIEDTFRSDGEGGRLGLYQVWGRQDV